jgi:hypothetical protein
MKQLAARDFEDLLQVSISRLMLVPMQCSIPTFEGLLEGEHNEQLMKLLFKLAQWHALAKLRMHTDSTVTMLQQTTVELGKAMRQFRDKTATSFATFDLPQEQQARTRRRKKADARRHQAASQSGQPQAETSSTSRQPRAETSSTSARKPQMLNLNTYKYHSLGDYAPTIPSYATSDNYSTQIVRPLALLSVYIVDVWCDRASLCIAW